MENFAEFFSKTIDDKVGFKKKFKNYTELAYTADVSTSNITHLRQGKTKNPGMDILSKLSNALEVDLISAWKEINVKTGFLKEKNIPDWLKDHVITLDKTKMRKAPVFTVAAGGFLFDCLPDDYPLGQSDRYEWTNSTDPNALFVEVEGESMAGAGIHEGDLLELEPNQEVQNGDIVVCRKNGSGVTVKKLIIKTDHIILQPMNPTYEPIMITKEESQECKFIKVSEVRRKL